MLSPSPQAYTAVMQSPLGPLGLRTRDDVLVSVDFLSSDSPGSFPKGEVAARAVDQLKRYFDGSLTRFELPLGLSGTPFQRQVWRALQAIPFGEVRTYGELARKLGSSARAVGGACRANPVPLVVPCHRVLAANGGLGGFAGDRVGGQTRLKAWLLRHERVPGWTQGTR